MAVNFRQTRTLLFSMVLVALCQSALFACPACGPILKPTWSERLARSDAALLVQWVEGERGKGPNSDGGSTTFEIVQIARDVEKTYKKGQRIFLPRYEVGKAGNLFFLWE